MTKAIILIGKTGSGKSTLANVISGTNKFNESESSTSITKEIQKEEFSDVDNEINYAVIDTVGIGDTQLKEDEVLDRIAEAVYLARDGIGQILFITGGRFDQFEMSIYNLLKTVIFDDYATDYTTVVRTRFPSFENKEDCQTDINSMLAEKELSEIVKSCQQRVIHVSNPSIENKAGRELKMRIEEREESRKLLLENLKNNCQSSNLYKPQKLQNLSNEIAKYMQTKLEAKEEIVKKQAEEKLENIEKDKENNLFSLKKYSKKKKLQSDVAVLEDEIDKLKEIKNLKEKIQEADGIIRRAVFNHIFNNIDDIHKVVGGDIFLNAIVNNKNDNVTNKLSFEKLLAKRGELEKKLLEKKDDDQSLEQTKEKINKKENELLELKKNLPDSDNDKEKINYSRVALYASSPIWVPIVAVSAVASSPILVPYIFLRRRRYYNEDGFEETFISEESEEQHIPPLMPIGMYDMMSEEVDVSSMPANTDEELEALVEQLDHSKL